MASKKNKDGLVAGQMVDHKEHNKWLIKERQAEKKAATAALIEKPKATNEEA